jgi:hypothetical protein
VRFRGSVSLEGLLPTAEEMLEASVPTSFRDAMLARLAKGRLSEPQRQLMFSYKLAFEAALPARYL